MKFRFKIIPVLLILLTLAELSGCKKDKFDQRASAKVEFSQDSILFDTVFTTIGSSTRNFRIRNKNSQKIKISSIILEGGSASFFKLNVDGQSGTSFQDLELAANDSMYVFVQVKVDPNNKNNPVIVSDNIHFVVNGNEQKVVLEAWGQDAYYHRPDSALKFKDGSYLPYSLINANKDSYVLSNGEYVWKNDKPHVIYGYLVVDEKQKLKIPAGTKVYLNYKAGIWVYVGGQIQVLGQKGNEVIFQGARREKDYLDEPGQWDRIWINQGSSNNIIDYAIIKNGYIGVQTELFGDDTIYAAERQLYLTNTKIQNMSMWGIYSLAYKIYGNNNVISNCQEHSLNILLGGGYRFVHCTFANFWNKQKTREKTTININNYSTLQVAPLNLYMGNCLVDGKLDNELTLDTKTEGAIPVTYTFSSCWMKTNATPSGTGLFKNCITADKNTTLKYGDIDKYDFSPAKDENRYSVFTSAEAQQDAIEFFNGLDINGKARNTSTVTAGAYARP